MAELRCSNCGKINPDFLDNCQFCQTPLVHEFTMHVGENPVKKDTGELEPILPQWLKDVRQQARESIAEDAAEEAAKAKVRNEPPDLLAGLASQRKDVQDEVPDWLKGITAVERPAADESPASQSENEFFSQFDQAPSGESLPWMGAAAESSDAGEKDELSEWLAKASAESSKQIEVESDDVNWMDSPDASSIKFKEPEQPKEVEDLSWLHSLEESTKEGSEPAAKKEESGWASAGELNISSNDDLGWLGQLGGVAPFKADEQEPKPSAEQKQEAPFEDLSWLNNLEAASAPPEQSEVTSTPELSADQPDWLKSPGGQPIASFEEKPLEGNLDWLKGIGQETLLPKDEPAQPRAPSTDQLSGQDEASIPAWLKSSTVEPSMPEPGVLAGFFPEEDAAVQSQFQPVASESTPPPSAESSSLSSKEIDSLFAADLPEWLSSPDAGGTVSEIEQPAPSRPVGDELLAPVDLPSWVQAMRPVESAISEAASVESQPAEREGPLAGLSGVIPVGPVGSSRRPKPISLKLQASDEQQSAAAILEQVLAGETNPRPLVTSTHLASQRFLRLVLAGLFVLVLGAMLFLGTQSMPVSAALPLEVLNASNAVVRLPSNSSVLVVMDYEPALAGEMEAVSGPLLDQLVLAVHPRLGFVSTSANGSALAERLLANTKISLPPPDGLGYQAGENYFNLGYLPGGSSGVMEFVQSPVSAVPNSAVNNLAEYSAVIVLTDHADSARAWIEQLDAQKQRDPSLASQPLVVVSSAQAGPLLQPYAASGQIAGMVNGISEAARYEFVNNSRPGLARRYWDSFGVGLLMAIVLIALGSFWNLISNIRAQRAEAELS